MQNQPVWNLPPQQADKVPALLWTELALLMQTPFTEFDFVCNSNNKIPIAKDSSAKTVTLKQFKRASCASQAWDGRWLLYNLNPPLGEMMSH